MRYIMPEAAARKPIRPRPTEDTPEVKELRAQLAKMETEKKMIEAGRKPPEDSLWVEEAMQHVPCTITRLGQLMLFKRVTALVKLLKEKKLVTLKKSSRGKTWIHER